MYRRAFSTLGCGELSLDEVFALADRHGIPAVELRALAGGIDLPGYLEAKSGTPEALAAQLGEKGSRIVALDTSFRLVDGTPGDRETLLRHVAWAEALGVRWLRVFDGGKELDDATIRRAREGLEWWTTFRRERGWNVDLMIETHDSLLDAKRIRTLVEAVPGGSVNLLWDAHHTWHKGGEDPVTTWREIGRHVVHVHVKDSVGGPGRNPDSRPHIRRPAREVFPCRRCAPFWLPGFRAP